MSEEGTKNNHESVEDQVEKLRGKVQTENKTIMNIDDSSLSCPKDVLHLLVKNLQTFNTNSILHVLKVNDMVLINESIQNLPVELVVPLLNAIHEALQIKRCDVGVAKWLKELLSVHKSYIISVSECQELMEQIHKILETRTQHYSSVFQLVGKLDMLDKQLRDRVDASNAGDSKEQEPLLLYQDDSSDELENVIDDLLVPGSDSGDDWEEEDDDNDDNRDESDDSGDDWEEEDDDNDDNRDESDDSIEIVNDEEMDDDDDDDMSS